MTGAAVIETPIFFYFIVRGNFDLPPVNSKKSYKAFASINKAIHIIFFGILDSEVRIFSFRFILNGRRAARPPTPGYSYNTAVKESKYDPKTFFNIM